MLNSIKDLPNGIWCLCAATLISRSGTMALVFLSAYLSSLGISEMRAGLAISIYGLGAFIAAPLGGYLCDRFGSKCVMELGLLFQGFILLMFPTVSGFECVLLLTLMWSLAGEVFRPASLTFIASVADEKLRRVAFSLNRIAVNVGMSIGPALGGFLVYTRPSLIFLANGGTSLFAGVLLTYCLRGKSFAACHELERQEQQTLRGSSLFPFLLALIPVFVVFYQYKSTMAQYFVGHQILKPYIFGLLLPVNALMVMVLQVPLTLYLQKFNQKLSMSLGAFLIGVGFGCFVFPTTYLGAALCVVVWTLGQIILFSGSESYICMIAEGRQGPYMGLYQMAMNFAAFIAPGLGSILLGQSAPLLWVAMLTLGFLSAVILLRVTQQIRGTKDSVPVTTSAGVVLPLATR